MRSTGIVRKVDELGRVVLPKELRTTHDMNPKEPLEIFVEGDTILLRRYVPLCYICGGDKDLRTFKEKRICQTCIEECKEII